MPTLEFIAEIKLLKEKNEKQQAEMDVYKSMLLEAHSLLMKVRKLSTTPTEVLNWSARLSVLAKHKGE